MRFKFLSISTVLLFQVAGAQTGTTSATMSPAGTLTPVSAAASGPTNTSEASGSANASSSDQIAIIDYKSVYEAPTVEEEVKMAAERFSLTQSQQEVWHNAALDRRQAEKVVQDKFDAKASNYEKDGAYRGLRTSHNTFYEIITGYLTPVQKQRMESDRLILQEKQNRLAKLPPPPPPAPTVTVATIDSTAIKEAEKAKSKGKGKGKKSKKKG